MTVMAMMSNIRRQQNRRESFAQLPHVSLSSPLFRRTKAQNLSDLCVSVPTDSAEEAETLAGIRILFDVVIDDAGRREGPIQPVRGTTQRPVLRAKTSYNGTGPCQKAVGVLGTIP